MSIETKFDHVAHLKQLRDTYGLTFAQCVEVFGVDRDTNPYAQYADTHLGDEGEVEIDDRVVVSPSEGGAYVSAWLWVPDSRIMWSTVNTEAVRDRIAQAFPQSDEGLAHSKFTLHFEHGQWWVTCPHCGRQWSVVDAEGGPAVDGFDFEEVTHGDESCDA